MKKKIIIIVGAAIFFLCVGNIFLYIQGIGDTQEKRQEILNRKLGYVEIVSEVIQGDSIICQISRNSGIGYAQFKYDGVSYRYNNYALSNENILFKTENIDGKLSYIMVHKEPTLDTMKLQYMNKEEAKVIEVKEVAVNGQEICIIEDTQEQSYSLKVSYYDEEGNEIEKGGQ